MRNSGRFISAYNKVDSTLRAVYGFKTNMTFSDMVRRSVPLNSVVRMYEDELIAYARLRNAIVHNSGDGDVIAEPHDDVTEHFEKIAKLIATPPLAFPVLCKSPVSLEKSGTKLAEVIQHIKRTDHSNIPVYDDGQMLGVVNNKILVEAVGHVLARGESVDQFLRVTAVEEILRPSMADVYYTLLPKTATLEQVLNTFEKNRKLVAIIITPHGNALELPVGMITPSDILDINTILEDYN